MGNHQLHTICQGLLFMLEFMHLGIVSEGAQWGFIQCALCVNPLQQYSSVYLFDIYSIMLVISFSNLFL